MIRIILLVILSTSFISSNISSSAKSYEIIEDLASTPILTPTFSETKSLKLRLNNELEVLLISDPGVDKASAALIVNTGAWEDPKEHPGMAHFLEHLLFLGTNKYPEEEGYQRFITEHNGKYNAFTGSDLTAYLFSIEHHAYPEALDRLSDFFKNPLFNPSGVERELHAINQEHVKNFDSEIWRHYFVLKELAHPNHPYHAFATGNLESLKHVTREELIKWYNTHYSANRMRLITVSNKPLETLVELVTEAFGDIKNHQLPKTEIDLPIIQDSIKGQMVYVEPITATRTLRLTWDLPKNFVEMRTTKPEELVSYVLQHQGRSSLLADLKRSKLANGISAGGDILGYQNMVFVIEIDLTDEGVRNVDEVILRTYEAIANFKARGMPHFLFDEIQTMNKVNYQYQSRVDAFSGIMEAAIISVREPLSTFPEKSCLISDFDPVAVKSLLNQLSPQSCLYTLVAPKALTAVDYDRKEQWMGVEYTIKAISQKSLDDWEQAFPNPRIDIPAHNPFIPEQLAMHSSYDFASDFEPVTPNLILDSELGKVYAAHDNYFQIPQVSWNFYIRTPLITAEKPETIVLAELYTECLMEELRSYVYPAAIAGLQFSISPGANGIDLVVSGYSDKADELFQDLVSQIVAFQPNQSQFKSQKENLLKLYRSSDTVTPLKQGVEFLYSTLYKNFVTNKAKINPAKKISFDKFRKFVAALYKKTSIDGMLYGNMPIDQPNEITQYLIRSLQSEPYPESEHLSKEVIDLPAENGPFFVERKIHAQANVAILTIQAGPYSLKGKAASSILMQAIKQPFFSELRTKQQTGYLVHSLAEEHELHLHHTFIVQSNTHDGKDLLSRYELFLEEFLQEMSKTEITIDRFENIRHALLSDLKQPPKSIASAAAALYKLATEHGGDFLAKDKLIQAFEELNYFEFLEYAHQVLGKQNKRRLGLLLKGNLDQDNALEYTQINSTEALQKLTK